MASLIFNWKRVEAESRILKQSFASFDVQAVMPVILVKPIDTSPLASVNISPPTNIPTSLSICEVLKIVAPGVQKTVL